MCFFPTMHHLLSPAHPHYPSLGNKPTWYHLPTKRTDPGTWGKQKVRHSLKPRINSNDQWKQTLPSKIQLLLSLLFGGPFTQFLTSWEIWEIQPKVRVMGMGVAGKSRWGWGGGERLYHGISKANTISGTEMWEHCVTGTVTVISNYRIAESDKDCKASSAVDLLWSTYTVVKYCDLISMAAPLLSYIFHKKYTIGFFSL